MVEKNCTRITLKARLFYLNTNETSFVSLLLK
jgi:hypothetical protein